MKIGPFLCVTITPATHHPFPPFSTNRIHSTTTSASYLHSFLILFPLPSLPVKSALHPTYNKRLVTPKPILLLSIHLANNFYEKEI